MLYRSKGLILLFPKAVKITMQDHKNAIADGPEGYNIKHDMPHCSKAANEVEGCISIPRFPGI
jgi:hypothetical protein